MKLLTERDDAARALSAGAIASLPATRWLPFATNAFSKKVGNHKHALALFLMFYNFARIHQTLRVAPAMEAGVSDHVWTLEAIAALADENSK